MSGFDFRLDRVLDLRRAEVKQRAQEYAGARAALRVAEERVADLEAARIRGRADDPTRTDATAGSFAVIDEALRSIEMQLQEAERIRMEAVSRVEEAGEVLAAARQQTRALERLRGRAFDRWRVQAAAREQHILDDLARNSHPSSLRPTF